VTHQSALTPISDFFPSSEVAMTWQTDGVCYDLKLKLRLHLGKDLRKDKGCIEVVKCKDTG